MRFDVENSCVIVGFLLYRHRKNGALSVVGGTGLLMHGPETIDLGVVTNGDY